MISYSLDFNRNAVDQLTKNKLCSPTNSPNFTAQLVLWWFSVSFSHPTEHSPYNNSSPCIFSCC